MGTLTGYVMRLPPALQPNRIMRILLLLAAAVVFDILPVALILMARGFGDVAKRSGWIAASGACCVPSDRLDSRVARGLRA